MGVAMLDGRVQLPDGSSSLCYLNLKNHSVFPPKSMKLILSFALISKQCELPVKAAFADQEKKS